MSLKSAISEFFNPSDADPKDAKHIPKPGLASNRVLLLVGFAALLIVRSLLTEHTITLLAAAVGLYIVSATVTTVFRDRENGRTERLKLSLAWRDGVISAEEAVSLGIEPTKVPGVASVEVKASSA